MPSLRFQALNAVLTRNIPEVKLPTRLSDIYACNVFDKKKMKEFLSEEAMDSVNDSIIHGASIERDIAEQVAAAMK